MTQSKVLFVCTGNSCRSQIAEGYARHFGGDRLHVSSAGIEADGKNARAIAVMAEEGIDISGQESTRIVEEVLTRASIVVTLSSRADKACAALPEGTRRLHWSIEDPFDATGTESDIMQQYRAARDEIRGKVEELLRREIHRPSDEK